MGHLPEGRRDFAGPDAPGTAPAESDEVSRYYMCGTFLGVVEGRLVAVATNGHMMVAIDLIEAPDDWPPCILPSKLTTLLVRLLKDAEGAVEVRDAVGNLLADGDQVTLIKDLEVKGAGQTLKRGTLIKSIRLTGDAQEIDCRFDGIKGLVLRAEFVKKR